VIKPIFLCLILLYAIPARADVTAGLVGHWTFDEGSGTTVIDSSVSNNHGFLVNGASSISGKVGKGLVLDGTDDYVTTDAVKSQNSLNNLSAMSISYWIKADVVGGEVFGRWGTGRQFYQYFSSQKIRMSWRYGGTGAGGTSLDNTSVTSLIPGVWTHVVAVYNDPTASLYINGTLDSSRAGTGGTLNTVTDALQFGHRGAGSVAYFKGGLDEIKIYNRALTPSEVVALFVEGGGIAPDIAPPTITNLNASNVSFSSANIKWTTSEDATTQIEYGKTIAYGSQTTLDSNMIQTHSLIISGLEPGITYYIRVKSKDAAGNLSQSTLTFTTSTGGSGGNYTVKKDGTGDFTTIQTCADVVRAGQKCLVYPGTYAEHVLTRAGGLDDNARIVFEAQGTVTMQGFHIHHPYVTVKGFDITGYTASYQAHIVAAKSGSYGPGGDYCKVLQNTIRDGAPNVNGFTLDSKGCEIKDNTIINLLNTFVTTGGSGHLIEGNTFSTLNNRNFMYVFGHDHTFRRNKFYNGNRIPGVGTHPDWVQTFGDNGGESYNMLFEENWVENLDAQLGQVNSGGGERGILPTFHHWTFRRNIFVNVSNNFNSSFPYQTWENNTFYRMAYTQNGIGFGGSLTRGNGSGTIIRNNVFLAGGEKPDNTEDSKGFYSFTEGSLTKEVIRTFALPSNDEALEAISQAIFNDMVNQGYLVAPEGQITDKTKALTNISQFTLNEQYASFKNELYKNLLAIVQDVVEEGKNTVMDVGFVRYLINEVTTGLISQNLVSNGYLQSTNGNVTQKAKDLTNISQFVMGTDLAPYKTAVYDLLTRTVALADSMEGTAYVDYNFVAGSPASNYPAKRTRECGTTGKYVEFNFCETHGINGGDPKLQMFHDPQITTPRIAGGPFTSLDGLKPKPDSFLCKAGRIKEIEAATGREIIKNIDMGAYSCDPNKVFAEPYPDVQDVVNNGDVSEDGRVTMHDAALVLRYALGAPLTDAQKEKADINGDGQVNAADALAIARKALGL
jgi:hypothetical protein